MTLSSEPVSLHALLDVACSAHEHISPNESLQTPLLSLEIICPCVMPCHRWRTPSPSSLTLRPNRRQSNTSACRRLAWFSRSRKPVVDAASPARGELRGVRAQTSSKHVGRIYGVKSTHWENDSRVIQDIKFIGIAPLNYGRAAWQCSLK